MARLILNTITICFAFLLSACGSLSNSQETASRDKVARSDGKTEVLLLGSIHERHRDSDKYSVQRLQSIIREFDPDIILGEIEAGKAEAAISSYRRTGQVRNDRLQKYPEITEAIIPLHDEIGFWLVGTSPWTEEKAERRNAKIKLISGDPARASEWREYLNARDEFDLARQDRGDDPLFLHSETYDKLSEAAHADFIKYFDKDLGEDSWTATNTAQVENMEQILNVVQGKGKRILIIYGAEHLYWIKREFQKRDDLIFTDPITYFVQNPT